MSGGLTASVGRTFSLSFSSSSPSFANLFSFLALFAALCRNFLEGFARSSASISTPSTVGAPLMASGAGLSSFELSELSSALSLFLVGGGMGFSKALNSRASTLTCALDIGLDSGAATSGGRSKLGGVGSWRVEEDGTGTSDEEGCAEAGGGFGGRTMGRKEGPVTVGATMGALEGPVVEE